MDEFLQGYLWGALIGISAIVVTLSFAARNDTTVTRLPWVTKRKPRSSEVAVRQIKSTLNGWLDDGMAADVQKALDQMGIER